MDAGGLAQMSQPSFPPAVGVGIPTGGLASRRGGQGIKPLSFDALKSAAVDQPAPTPRTTARAHLLAGLRTAPKSATAATFSAAGATTSPSQARDRSSIAGGVYGNDNLYSGPKTSLPRGYAQQQQQQQQAFNLAQQQARQAQLMQQIQQQQQPLYTPDQILAPPEIILEEQAQDQIDPTTYANLVTTNLYLAQQQQRLQQQLMSLQAAQQQFQGLNLNGTSAYHQNYLHQQQQQQLQMQLKNMQQQMMTQSISLMNQGGLCTVFDPTTGQTYLVEQPAQQPVTQFADQYGTAVHYQLQQQQAVAAPRVQVSPPPIEAHQNNFRNSSPPRRFESPEQPHTPLPPPSANAFRRGHKKSSSVSNGNSVLSLSANDSGPKSPGPKSADFPVTPLTGGYGPGQARAGEHPIRQPRGPPSFDELRSKPTSKHEGSKNFAGRTRISALSNLVRAGITRRQVTSTGSSGSISPISESAEEQLPTPLTEDDESVSVRSGSGSLNGDEVECSLPSSRSSTGSWGAIGSDRPSSRQKARKSVDSLSNASDTEGGSSFASIFKSSGKTQEAEITSQRKAPMLVLNRAEKRKNESGPVAVA